MVKMVYLDRQKYYVAYFIFYHAVLVECSELGHWFELGQKFSESSFLRLLVNAYLMTNNKGDNSLNFCLNSHAPFYGTDNYVFLFWKFIKKMIRTQELYHARFNLKKHAAFVMFKFIIKWYPT